MRRRQREQSPGGLHFNGKTYPSAADRDEAVAAWQARRERLVALAEADPGPPGP